jgi:hypothetical protein
MPPKNRPRQEEEVDGDQQEESGEIVKLSMDDKAQLIDEVRKYSSIWQIKQKGYRDSLQSANAWTAVSKALSLEGIVTFGPGVPFSIVFGAITRIFAFFYPSPPKRLFYSY